ncbi:MAG: metallophosphoesterase [Bacteroidaceae bacterium]|nr:metallophosphoesterase [Bacteroidaceae bacterium]
MNFLWASIFFLLPLLGLAYVGWHVWLLLPWGALAKSHVLVLGVASFLLLFFDVSGRLDAMSLSLARVLYKIGTSSLFILLYLVMLFLVLDLGRLCHVVPRSWLYANGWTALGVAAVIISVFSYGYLRYRHKVRVPLKVHTTKPLARPLRVVMASDLHLGYHNDRRELARWVDLMNAEHPDFILIAGDIVDLSVRPLLDEDMAAEFRRLSAPVYACLGNHEYYSGQPRARQFYRDAGIRLLIDEVALLPQKPSAKGEGTPIVLIGRDDRTNRRRKPLSYLMDEARAVVRTFFPRQTKGEGVFIVLDHQPYHLEKAEREGVDFQLSGHTHRGQVWPASWLTDWMYECSWGPHRRGRTQYYVSSGIGIWGGRFRIGTQSEYVVATFTN